MKKHNFFDRTEEISSSAWRKRIILSFIIFAILVTGAVFTWKWLNNQPREKGALAPLRTTLETNEKVFSTIYNDKYLSSIYSQSDAAKKVRVNGNLGMKDTVDMSTWRLQVVRAAGDTLKVSLDEIKQLPKEDVIFNFKCIEGWSQITHWAGVPMKTFMEHYHLDTLEKMNYIGLQTPDKKYYVGIDMASGLHPQTILCYELNGQPLPINQGYPLRLIIPVKYGIKHIKRIGTMYFSDQKPPDYWAERGYDYYAGL
jgi:hypothetical protein